MDTNLSVVHWVYKTLHKKNKKNCELFIQKYLEEYNTLKVSYNKIVDDVNRPGLYFTNFINTCHDLLVSNPIPYHYRPDMKICQKLPNPGPTKVYSLLLEHIVENAENYRRRDAKAIDTLLFSWFEQFGISGIMIIPLNKKCKDIFEKYKIKSSRADIGERDGNLTYCSLIGRVKHGGMDISNTRVSSLLNQIHNVRPRDARVDAGVDDDDDDDGAPYFATPYTPAGATPFLATPFPATPAGVNPFVTPAGAGAGVEEVDGGKKRHAKTNKRSTRTKRRGHTRRRRH